MRSFLWFENDFKHHTEENDLCVPERVIGALARSAKWSFKLLKIVKWQFYIRQFGQVRHFFCYFETGAQHQIVSTTFCLANVEGWISAGINAEEQKTLLYDLQDILALKFHHYHPNYLHSDSHTSLIFRHVSKLFKAITATHDLPGHQRSLPVPPSLEVLDRPVNIDSFNSSLVKCRTSHETNSN